MANGALVCMRLGVWGIGSTEQVMPEIRTHLEAALAATQRHVEQPIKPGGSSIFQR